jgi:hypothetical protein
MSRDITEIEAELLLAAIQEKMRRSREELLAQGRPTHSMDLDIELTPEILDKVRTSQSYAQNLYAAMCNRDWQEQDVWEVLRDQTWGCTWRTAGGIIAAWRGEGDYMDWYCSGIGANEHPETKYVGEGFVTDEIRRDLAQIGWRPIDDHDEEL